MMITQAWWRTDPLNPEEMGLLNCLFEAHHYSSFRNNASSVTVANAASGSGELSKAIAAGLMTIGTKHAPLVQTYAFLNEPDPGLRVPEFLKVGWKVPGWGGTFQKDKPDPIWEDVKLTLKRLYPALSQKLESVTERLHQNGKLIYPNPSAYTASVALALALPAELAPYFFIAARLNAWSKIAADQIYRK